MIKKFLIVFFFFGLICHLKALSQNNIIKGKIIFQSSGNKPAKGVKIVADGTNSTYTSSSGLFELKFPTKKQGDRINLNIGINDENGLRIELVNDTLIKYARIPSSPNELLEIIVCKYGELEQNKTKYNGILQNGLQKAYKKAISTIDSLISLNTSNQKELTKLNLQKDSITRAYEIAKEEITKQAAFIAQINLDKASTRIKEALSLINRDKDIPKALSLLDTASIQNDYQSALKLKQQADKSIMRSVEEYELRISILYTQLEFLQIAFCYKEIIKIYIENHYDQYRLSTYYLQLATAYDFFGDNDNSLENLVSSLSIREALLQPNDTSLAIIYNNVGIAYKKRGEFSKAYPYLFKGVSIFEKAYGAESCQVAFAYNNIGITYDSDGQPEKALEYHIKSLNLRERCLPIDDYALGLAYNNIAMAYEKVNKVDTAINYLFRAIKIFETKDLYGLSMAHNNLATCYLHINKPKEARKFSSMAIKELETINNYHADLVNFYFNAAISYQQLNKVDSAQFYLEKSVLVLSKLSYVHPLAIDIYLSLGETYFLTRNEIKALQTLSVGLALCNKLKINNNVTSKFYEIKGDAFYNLRHYDSAVMNYNKALSYSMLDLKDSSFLCTKIADLEYELKNYRTSIDYLLIAISIEEKTGFRNVKNLSEDYKKISLNFYCLNDNKQVVENLEKAITYFEKYLLKDSPDMLNYYHSLAFMYIKTQALTKARKLFNKLDSLAKNDFRNYLNWTSYYSLKNRKRKALENLQRAIDLGFIDLSWITEEKSLRNIRHTIAYKELVKKISQLQSKPQH